MDTATPALPSRPTPQDGAIEPIDETFLGVLAHEIRTPVTAIYVGSRLLADPDLPERSRRAVTDDLVIEVERLYRSMEDILVLGWLDHGALEPEQVPVALAHVALEAIGDERVLARDHRISFTGPRDIAAEAADPTLVRHVIRNLIDNAVRSSGPRDLVEVVVEASEDEVSVRVLDRVEDAGIHGATAFELSASEPATRAQRAGGGLGLLVIGRLVGAMGGRVWAHRRDPRGTEFGFSLPRAAG